MPNGLWPSVASASVVASMVVSVVPVAAVASVVGVPALASMVVSPPWGSPSWGADR